MIRATLAAAAALSFAATARAGDPAAGPEHFTLVRAGDGVFAAIARDGDTAALGNAGFVVAPDAVLVVDTFATEAAAQELAEAIRRTTDRPVRWVVNTHYHYDHLGGDAVFTRQGAVVIAHENVRAWVRTENLKWRKELTAADRDMLAHLALPDVTHRDGATLWLGGNRRAEVIARPGHTGGDSIVWIPEAGVVFAGDLLWKATIPNMIDASTEPWVATLDGFLDAYPAATFVPGHGELAKALDVRYFRDYLFGLRSGVSQAVAQGKSGPALVDYLLPLQKQKFGGWRWFDSFGARNIAWEEEELAGKKKLPRPPPTPPAP